jgi:hypothetical protein
MRLLLRWAARIGLFLFLAGSVIAGTPGSFRGTIVDTPQGAAAKNWIYVQGRNGMARRVEISRARVTYDESVPAANRRGDPVDALTPGVEVRVTAEQGTDGEWRASRIEILKAAVSGPSGTRTREGMGILRLAQRRARSG